MVIFPRERRRYLPVWVFGPDENLRCSRSHIRALAVYGLHTVTVNYILPDNEKVTVKAKEGQNLLDIVLDNDVDIDGYGACEGTLACSTCHLIFEQDVYDNLPEQPTDEELDMLDLAYGLTDTSRLGCQVCVTKEMDGLTVKVPESISDARTV
ncbi:adrenodoxin-like isoform X2 [Ptychodera flava]|uniref:adrenodoxin-like isoform X2 n=1 Tax=Ptychodera flava TaxID=63121 RepID=UPI00396A09EC